VVIENLLLVISPGRQCVRQFGNAGGKLPQSIGEFLRHHADALYMTDDRFSMTNFQSFQSLEPFPSWRRAKRSEMHMQAGFPEKSVCLPGGLW
jgi:hypothetical protein